MEVGNFDGGWKFRWRLEFSMEVGVLDGGWCFRWNRKYGKFLFFFTAASAKSSGFSLIEDFLQEHGGPL